MSETVQETSEATRNEDTEAPAADSAGHDAVLVREGDVAGDYLERLLDLLDYDGDLSLIHI